MNARRRNLIRALLAGGAAGAIGSATAATGATGKARVVVIGGGFGGATAAKYLRHFGAGTIDVLLVEPNEAFISCPLSNLVVAGARPLDALTTPYAALGRKHGVELVRDRATAIDAANRTVKLARGADLRYDKLVLAPGVDFMFDKVEGLQTAHESGRVLHAWKAGEETTQLARQLADMRDGGVFAITIPEQPYRCPPGPYERASLVASYLKQHKPKSKVLILDANMDVTSKGPLFKKAWADLYPGLVEYRGQQRLIGVDAGTSTLRFDFDEVKADVLNVLPPMRAGALAVDAGLANANARWCFVNFRNFESTAAANVHVIGDAIQTANLMPKSGHMANAHAKVAAAAIVSELAGIELDPAPMLTNTCYSFVSPDEAMHVASVHRYMAADKTFVPVAGAGGVSSVRSALEASYANSWARNIWADALG